MEILVSSEMIESKIIYKTVMELGEKMNLRIEETTHMDSSKSYKILDPIEDGLGALVIRYITKGTIKLRR
jgi:hypothetical protein